ncbi:MAG: YtxH domain-containing protein [Elusimicrobia bacterium]|nr:YtxH domain-containing protein [Elusimicrobiota bacterium]
MDNKHNRSFGGWYLLTGVIVGAAAGLLFAPKAGNQTREDIEDWSRRNRKKTRSWLSSIGDALPVRVKAAAGVGAIKEGAEEAFEIAKDKAEDYAPSR